MAASAWHLGDLLNNPQAGGGTSFPDVGLEVAPRRGAMRCSSATRARPRNQKLHGGSPVIAGEKWIAPVVREGDSSKTAAAAGPPRRQRPLFVSTA
ncbi:hypothetical protein ACFODQ_05165 [Comamonas sp. JC664]